MTEKGGKYCVTGFANARSCKNSSYSKGISMHMFPRDDKQRAAWTKFVRKHRPGWNPTTSSAICSAHFQGNDFTQRLNIDIPTAPDRSSSNISCKRYLTHGTIPTIEDYDIASKSFPQTATLEPTTPQIPAAKVQRAKRQLLRDVCQSTKGPKILDESVAMAENQVEGSCGDERRSTVFLSQDQSFPHGEQVINVLKSQTNGLLVNES
ncbi:THAP domain-containing 2-like [Paramuricea clavata]|uniref:THAP domain-containing 2-like n=1 Tax=Paramuricea clavata TaxID=317549 RepID=A0A7D9K287_PARCT|nr:THAP domain-containing 2-like [Paramuricea clavata]